MSVDVKSLYSHHVPIQIYEGGENAMLVVDEVEGIFKSACEVSCTFVWSSSAGEVTALEGVVSGHDTAGGGGDEHWEYPNGKVFIVFESTLKFLPCDV